MARSTPDRSALPLGLAFLHAAVAWVMLLLACPIPSALACGTPPPQDCTTTTSIIIMSPRVILNQPGGVTVPITYTVFIGSAGSPGVPCATRLGTGVTFSTVCTGGPSPVPPAAILLGPISGSFSGIANIAFPPGPARTCTITGTAATAYSSGATISGTATTTVCLVDPVPGDPSRPRLDLQLISAPSQSAHPGDQRSHIYRLTNNDPTHSVTGTLTGSSNQLGRLSTSVPPPAPGSGSAPSSAASPISGDAFPIEFGSGSPTPLAPNNYTTDDGTAEDGIGLSTTGSMIWLNDFIKVAGQEVIDRISVVFRTASMNGKRVTLALWSDPNSDGNPADALLLYTQDVIAANGGTNTYNDYPILPVALPGAAGVAHFFVGAMVESTALPELPAALDQTPPNLNRSWVAANNACAADINTLSANLLPPALISSFGFPGNFLIRAHGSPAAGLRSCVTRGDPGAASVLSIAQSITLCPGESRVVRINQRSFPMCRSGSCSHQLTMFDGTFDDASLAKGCAGAGLMVDSAVPPDFRCADGGMMTIAAPYPPGGPGALHFTGTMPTHPLDQSFRLLNVQVIPSVGPPPNFAAPQTGVLDTNPPRNNAGRITMPGTFPSPQPVGPPMTVVIVLETLSLVGQTNVIQGIPDVHPGDPALGDSYFFVNSHSRITGPGIPPTLDSFFDVFSTVSLDGISSGLHRKSQILPGIIVTPMGPTVFSVNFQTFFPTVPSLPPTVDSLRIHIDGVGSATGAPATVKCPVALNVEQAVETSATQTVHIGVAVDGDGPLSFQWRKNTVPINDTGHVTGTRTAELTIVNAVAADAGTYDCQVSNSCGAPVIPGAKLYCRADVNHSFTVNVADIFSFLSLWFALDPLADFNHSGTINVADIFAMLSAWFSGC